MSDTYSYDKKEWDYENRNHGGPQGSTGGSEGGE
jgi:hypothetical protein